MTGIKKLRRPKRETLTEAYEVRAFPEENPEQTAIIYQRGPIPDLEGLQAMKDNVLGHGEQRVVPDDCQFGDNDLCNLES